MQPGERELVARLEQLAHEVGGGGEGDPVTAAGGLHAERDREVRLAHADRLSDAERERLITHNPARLVRMQTPTRREREPFTPEQAPALLDQVANDRLAALYQLAMATGMRQGEILGLTWEGVDLGAGSVTVRRAIKRYDGEYHLDEPKTERSRRTLALPATSRRPAKAPRRAESSSGSWLAMTGSAKTGTSCSQRRTAGGCTPRS